MLKNSLRHIALLFLKLGFISFGGPAVHIAMMEEEVVRKRKWMSHEHFLDLISATNLIPGPNSTEMSMHCGREQAGWKGLIVAGFCFITPAVLLTALFAWFYANYGQLPSVKPFIYGIKPAIIAVVIAAIIPLAKKSVTGWFYALLGFAVLAACFCGLPEILVLFGAGFLGMLFHALTINRNTPVLFAPMGSIALSNTKLFLTFLKIGSILYGSGYVLFSFLDTELVQKGYLSREQLADAIAVGQFTPGPVFSSATFIGWQINGCYGALAATIGIFLPSFLLVALLNPLIPALRKSRIMSAFLNAVNVASVALILFTCIQMGRDTMTSWQGLCIGSISIFLLLFLKKINSAWIVIGGGISGYILQLF
ncbi:MAG: chromate efflux transporter [Bacteroidetes bacterium]|nr:chromate efflux transporter [Bacteroidota bacterium]